MPSSRALLTIPFALLLGLAPFAARAHVTSPEAPPSSWRKNSWGFSMVGEYFTSRANYDDVRGSFERLPGANSYSVLDSTVRGRYAFLPRFSGYGGFGFAHASASDSRATKTNSGVTNLFLGLNYQLSRKWIRLLPEVEAGFALNSNQIAMSTPMIGEGAPYARVGLWAIKPIRRFVIRGYLGVWSPFDGLAKRLQYSATGELGVWKRFLVGGGLNGYEAFTTDGSPQSSRKAAVFAANAGSARYWAFEPALLETRIWFGFKPDRFSSARIGFAKTLNGLRTAEGQSMLLSYVFNAPGTTWEKEPSPFEKMQRPLRPEESVETADPSEFQADDAPDRPDEPAAESSEALDDAERRLEKRKRR